MLRPEKSHFSLAQDRKYQKPWPGGFQQTGGDECQQRSDQSGKQEEQNLRQDEASLRILETIKGRQRCWEVWDATRSCRALGDFSVTVWCWHRATSRQHSLGGTFCSFVPVPVPKPPPSQANSPQTNKRQRNYNRQRRKTVNGIKQSKALSQPRALSHNKCVAQIKGSGHSLATQTGSQGGKTFCPHLQYGRWEWWERGRGEGGRR